LSRAFQPQAVTFCSHWTLHSSAVLQSKYTSSLNTILLSNLQFPDLPKKFKHHGYASSEGYAMFRCCFIGESISIGLSANNLT
jgi:hypothetical protein